jgi:hypothetical protein
MTPAGVRFFIITMRTTLFITLGSLLVLLGGCSSESTVPVTQSPQAPSWTLQPARSMSADQSMITYVGIGEDRLQSNARFKSEAIALQDLANDCSFVPKSTVIEDHFEEPMGIIFHAFAKVSINVKDCLEAKMMEDPTQIRNFSNPQFTAEILSYQSTYDAPEPEELRTLKPSAPPISDSSQLFVARQQWALANQKAILMPAVSFPQNEISQVRHSVLAFEKNNPEVWTSTQTFSSSRPNAINHQASAVRETIQERKHLQQEYDYKPTPLSRPQNKNSRSARGGGRHHGQVPQQQPDSSTPTPVPSGL